MDMILMEPVSRSGVLDLNMAARMSLPAARRRRGGRGGGGAAYTCMEAEDDASLVYTVWSTIMRTLYAAVR
jgi:hypothetical protein